MYVQIFKGAIRVWDLDGDHKLNVMPVDLVVNLMLTAGWQGRNTTAEDSPHIYHLSTGASGKNTWNKLGESIVFYIPGGNNSLIIHVITLIPFSKHKNGINQK